MNFKKNRRTYDSDRFEKTYQISPEGSFNLLYWELSPYVGPEAYNNGHVDLILDNPDNTVGKILETSENPYYLNRASLHQSKSKFNI